MCLTSEQIMARPIIDQRREHNSYPTNWLKTICHCYREDPKNPGPPFEWRYKIAATCSVCGKAEPWRLRVCSNCSEGFLIDFTHPAFCHFDPWCWDCLESFMPDSVDRHNSAAITGISQPKKGPVLGHLYSFITDPVDPHEFFGF